MSPDTGLIELQLRLPCNHVVGSGCITTWLKENNSCPLCRLEFFQPEPRGTHGNGIAEGLEHEVQVDEDGDEDDNDRLRLLKSLCLDYCIQLALYLKTINIAETIFPKLLRLYPFSESVSNVYDRSTVEVVALGIYIASCNTGHPRSPREICNVEDKNGDRIRDSLGIHGDRIRELYGIIYERREELVDIHIRPFLERGEARWPSFDDQEMSDDEIECGRDLRDMRNRLAQDCTDLHLDFPIDALSQNIAGNLIHAGFRKLSHPDGSSYVHPSETAFVSVYIASHLVGQPVSQRAIEDLTGYSHAEIRYIYGLVRDKCDQLVSEAFQKTLDLRSWEILEADAGESDAGRQGGSQRDPSEEEDQANNEMEANTPDTLSRIHWTARLCTSYSNRLVLNRTYRTTGLAQQIAAKFSPVATLASCCPETLAAACVYVASAYMGYNIPYRDLVAATAVEISGFHNAHMLMAEEIVSGRVSVQDIVQSLPGRPLGVQDLGQLLLLPNT